jgi:hypothetical protein
MKIAATIREAASVGQALVWIGAAVFGLIATYLVTQAPPYRAVLEETARRIDEAQCVKLGFPIGTQDNLLASSTFAARGTMLSE